MCSLLWCQIGPLPLTRAAEIKASENGERGDFRDMGSGPSSPRGNGTRSTVGLLFSIKHQEDVEDTDVWMYLYTKINK